MRRVRTAPAVHHAATASAVSLGAGFEGCANGNATAQSCGTCTRSQALSSKAAYAASAGACTPASLGRVAGGAPEPGDSGA